MSHYSVTVICHMLPNEKSNKIELATRSAIQKITNANFRNSFRNTSYNVVETFRFCLTNFPNFINLVLLEKIPFNIFKHS